MKSSTSITRQQISKGASVVAQLQLERFNIVTDLRQDVRYYSRHAKRERWFTATMYRNRYRRVAQRTINPTKRNLIAAIQQLSYRLTMEECPHSLPCGADDAWYEVRDGWRLYLNRLCQAYKFVCYFERNKGGLA